MVTKHEQQGSVQSYRVIVPIFLVNKVIALAVLGKARIPEICACWKDSFMLLYQNILLQNLNITIFFNIKILMATIVFIFADSNTKTMIPLMTEALMMFPSDELWSSQISRKQKYWIHGSLFLLGTILVSAGCIDIFYFTEEGYHLYTVHGITGLISMILFILSMFFGVLASHSQNFIKYARPVILKFLHNSIGLIGYIIGMVSLCYAYYTNWFVYYTSEESRFVGLIATILGLLWTMNGSLVSAYNQIKTLWT